MKHLMRNRANPHIRELLAQNGLSISKLIQPIFIIEGLKGEEAILGLDGNNKMGIDAGLKQIESDLEKAVRQFMLFSVPEKKGINADSGAQIVRAIKQRFGNDLHLWVDTCLCSSSVDGHCCIFHQDKKQRGIIDLEASLLALSDYALAYADAGADGIAPSDMMDGRVGAIRNILDKNAHVNIPIMSYSTKFASQFYGPFRGAANSTPSFGDRKQYQIDVRNKNDALGASQRCASEGADLLMLKPGMSSIDLLSPIKRQNKLPVGVYQVSGEYASLVLLAKEGLSDFDKALLETWQVFSRAGAQYIITYGARKALDLGLSKT